MTNETFTGETQYNGRYNDPFIRENPYCAECGCRLDDDENGVEFCQECIDDITHSTLESELEYFLKP